MKALIVSLLITIALAGHLGAQDRKTYDVYDQKWKRQGYVREKRFTDDFEIFDRDWQRKGHVKRKRFTDGYEIYDENWNRMKTGSLDEGNDLQLDCR